MATCSLCVSPLLPSKGIPIIHNMQGSYVGDSIQSVMGIMNGTTNFMLTKMETEGADYAAVLKEAQDLGFAEGAALIFFCFTRGA